VNCDAAPAPAAQTHYQTHSICKYLILKSFGFCIFFGQAKESLDLQGPAASIDDLSTKLSTENLDELQTLAESTT
jgi:hypothetical protein